MGFLQNPYALNLLVSAVPITLPESAPMNDPTWFIAPLILMYVLFFFINRTTEKVQVICWVLCIVISGILRSIPALLSIPFIGGGTNRALLTFSIGAILHIAYRYYPRKLTLASGLMLLATAICFCFTGRDFLGWDQPGFERVFTYVIFPCLILFSCIQLKLPPLFVRIFTKAGGGISTMMYFCHTPIDILLGLIALVYPINFGSEGMFLFRAILIVFVSIIISHFTGKKLPR